MQQAMQEQGWSDELLLGLAVMDQSHQNLYAEIAFLAQASDDELAARFGDFVAHVEQDFNTEEAWMEEINFPGIRPHLEEHAMVLSALHHAAPHVVERDFAAARDILRLLPQWFSHHVLTQDKSLALALQMASIPV